MVSPSRFSLILSVLLMFAVVPVMAQSKAPDMEIVERWLAGNSGASALKIDFSQTRAMRSVKIPVRQDGTLWLDYRGNQFRWQTGNPAQTIVVSHGKKILIVRTPMKKFEIRVAGSGGAPGMAAMANGFPRNLSDFQRKYRLLEIRPQEKTQRIITRPLGEGGRGVKTLTFVVELTRFRLLGIEIELEDGSNLNTVFKKVQINPAIPAGLFKPSLDGYTETTF